jgi:hypothetical protein
VTLVKAGVASLRFRRQTEAQNLTGVLKLDSDSYRLAKRGRPYLPFTYITTATERSGRPALAPCKWRIYQGQVCWVATFGIRTVDVSHYE